MGLPMEFRQLSYFMAVYEQLHFSKAAEKLGIIQPTISQQIQVLEEELELPLFDRLGKRIVPTEAGNVLYDQCIPIMQHMRHINDAFMEMKQNVIGKLQLSVIPGAVDIMINSGYHDKFHACKLP